MQTQKGWIIAVIIVLIVTLMWLYKGESPTTTNTNTETDQTKEQPTEIQTKKPPQFEDYAVTAIFSGTPTKVNYTSNPTAGKYRTRLNKGVKNGANFAGHYSVVEIGCGSNCQNYWIIDVENGKIFEFMQLKSQRGATYKINSKLFIADKQPEISPSADDPTTTVPIRYFVFENNALKMVYRSVCSLDNQGKQVCEDKNSQAVIIQPIANDIWKLGETNTVRWTGGAPQVSLFLIEKSMETTGASVSIAERIQNIENTSSYDVVLMSTFKSGEYKWCLDDIEGAYVCGEYFRIENE